MDKRLFERKAVTKVQAAIAVVVIVVAAIAGVAYYLSLPPPPTPISEVKIGVLLPFTGPAAEVGKLEKMGIEFALDEINAAGGIKSLGGAELSVVWADHGGDPKTGSLECERLITAENVAAIMGAYYSSVTKTSSEVTERYEVPYLNPDSVSPTLTARDFKWFYRISPFDWHMIGAMFELIDYANEKQPGVIETLGVLIEDSEWGLSCRDMIVEFAEKHGYDIIKIVTFHSGTASFDVEVTTMKEANPDFLFTGAYTTDMILLTKTLKKLDYLPKMIAGEAGTEQPAWWEAVGDLSYYHCSVLKYNWDLVEKIPKIKEVNDAFKAKYGVDVSNEIARPYVGIYTLYTAIEEAGKVASPSDLEAFRKAIRDALENLDIGMEPRWMIMPWKGIKFDETHQNFLACGTMVQMMPDDGKYHTVWPKEFATAEPIVPMPSWSERP